jgi:hypothetical protein
VTRHRLTASPPTPAEVLGIRLLAVRQSGRCDDARMAGHTFTAQLWEHEPDRLGSWHFLTLPAELAEQVVAEAGPRHGFGSIRVEVRMGTTSWRTSLFPDSTTGSLLLPVKRDVRLAERIAPGSSCEVTVHLSS